MYPGKSGVACPHFTQVEKGDGANQIPSHSPKHYLPNLCCKDSNQGMIVGKCYWDYTLFTLSQRHVLIGPSHGWNLIMDLKPMFSHQMEDRFSVSMWKAWCDIRWGIKCDQPSSEPCIRDESSKAIRSSIARSRGSIAKGPTKSIQC